MKVKYLLTMFLIFVVQWVSACPVCDRQQPKVFMGITHGVGPGSNWDWVIIVAMTLIVLVTLFFSIKFLVKPGEKNNKQVKESILTEQ